jgi:hypothetical protein
MKNKKRNKIYPMCFLFLLIATSSVAIAGGRPSFNGSAYSKFQNSSEITYPDIRHDAIIRGKSIQALGLTKTQATNELQWKYISRISFRYSTTSKKWSYSSRDTFLYNSEGNLNGSKSTTTETGWSLNNIYHSDSTIWNGSRRIDDFDFCLKNGIIRDSVSFRTTWKYSNDFKTCVFTFYDRIFGDWKMYELDTTTYTMPIPGSYDPNDYNSPNLISNHKYFRNPMSGKMVFNMRYTKIEAESNDSMLAFLTESFSSLDTLNTPLSTHKTFKRFSSNGITCDSTMSKDLTGKWVNTEISTTEYVANDTRICINKYFQNGSLVNGYELISGKTEHHYRFSWDSSIKQWKAGWFILFDKHENDTLFGKIQWDTTTHSWDTTHQDYSKITYDDNGNCISSVYQTKDSANPWVKIDSTVYTYAQINSASAQIASQKASNPISISQTSRMLNVLTPGITGIRIYDIAGRLAVIVKQPAAPTFSLDLSKAGSSRMTAGRYLVQVETNKGRHTIPLLIMR